MAGQTRYLKVKDGRFYARIAVSLALRELVGKSELITPLGSDLSIGSQTCPLFGVQN